MAAPPVPDEILRNTIDTYNANDRNQVQTAIALNCSRGKVQDHLRMAARRGLLIDHPAAMPGFRVSRVNEGPNGKSIEQKPEHGGQFEMPPGHVVKGVSALVDPDGNEVVKWIKTSQDGEQRDAAMRAVVEDHRNCPRAKGDQAPNIINRPSRHRWYASRHLPSDPLAHGAWTHEEDERDGEYRHAAEQDRDNAPVGQVAKEADTGAA